MWHCDGESAPAPIAESSLAVNVNPRQCAAWGYKDVVSASSRPGSSCGVRTPHRSCFIWESNETVCHTQVDIAFTSSDGSDGIASNRRGGGTRGSEGGVSHSPFASLLSFYSGAGGTHSSIWKLTLTISQYRRCAWTQRGSHRDVDTSQDKSVLAQRLSSIGYRWRQSHDIWLQCQRPMWEYNSGYQ